MPADAGPTRDGRPTGWIDAAERLWLGRSFPPPREAIAATSWTIDGHNNYCPRCGGTVGEGEAADAGCAACRKTALSYAGTVRLGRHEGALRDWILDVKYHRWPEMGAHLGEALGRAVRDHPRFAEHRAAETILVPIPMPWLRRLYRGIDHARVMADGAGRALGAPVWPVLAKAPGPPQTSLTKTDRRKRRGGWIRPRRSIRSVRGLDIVLVDDVRTTGTTLRLASRLLKQAGARRIIAAVVAVADEPGRGRGRAKAQSTKQKIQT